MRIREAFDVELPVGYSLAGMVGVALIAAVLWAGASGAGTPPKAAPCRSVEYRTRVAYVLGLSDELLGSVEVARREQRLGHPAKSRDLLDAIHRYLPTYFAKEHRLVKQTVACGVRG